MSNEKLPRHTFWGAGEPDCPPDLKGSNGELHTMRCKVCGDGWRKSIDVCFAAVPELNLHEMDALGRTYFNGPLNAKEEMFGRAVERAVRRRLLGTDGVAPSQGQRCNVVPALSASEWLRSHELSHEAGFRVDLSACQAANILRDLLGADGVMEAQAPSEPEEQPPCPVCGGTERSRAGYLLCECPAASLKPAPEFRDTCTDPDNCRRCGHATPTWDQVNHEHAGIPVGPQKPALGVAEARHQTFSQEPPMGDENHG